ncbi:MAG TPA: NAD(P)H-binding protein [Ktedonobacterales bacterium]|nr:NAD(P)H-binding protein [Ktedonobacterales bacterium]
MQKILVTGGAGHLGHLVVKHLSAAGYSVRGMSRRASPGADWAGAEWKQADLRTGAGVAEAVAGMDVVVHLAAAGNSMVDFEGTRRVLDAAREAHVSHVVLISIVGIDRVPWSGGKAKLASEDLLARSGIPWSTIRATQFHYAIDFVLRFLTRLPLVALVPTDFPLQPVDEEEVAERLCEIVQAGPLGRLPDMGGPEVYTSGELARIWLKQRGMRRAIIPLWLPGKTARALRQGGNICPEQATGRVSWEAWLQQHYNSQRLAGNSRGGSVGQPAGRETGRAKMEVGTENP